MVWRIGAVSAVMAMSIFTLVGVSSASQVHPQKVPLKRAVEGAKLVVVAYLCAPFQSAKDYPLRARKGKKGAKPVFRKHLRHFAIEHVLSDRRSAKLKGKHHLRAGAKVAVANANWQMMRGLTQAYHLGQPMFSPIIATYKKGVDLDARSERKLSVKKRRRVILLLSQDPDGGYRFAISGVIVELNLKSKVQRFARGKSR